MQSIQRQYEDAAAEFEMAYEDGAAMYWWNRMQELEAIMAQERDLMDVAPDVLMEMMGD